MTKQSLEIAALPQVARNDDLRAFNAFALDSGSIDFGTWVPVLKPISCGEGSSLIIFPFR